MKTALEQLKQLAPPPEVPLYAGSMEQWDAVEMQLGTQLPQDFKELVCTYGKGEFAAYIAPYSPFTPKRSLVEVGRSLISSYRQLYVDTYEDEGRLPTFPEPGGILPWGRDDNAGILCWRTEGKPDDWTLLFLDSHYSPEYVEFQGSVTKFLVSWLSGTFVPDYFPEDIFPAESPLFVATAVGYE